MPAPTTPAAAERAGSDPTFGTHDATGRTPSKAGSDPTFSPRAKTVTGYSIPGQGSSTVISIVTVAALLALWWVATHYGWIRDLFLPTPEKILKSFGDAWRGDIQGGRPLPEHFWASLWRVFAAFLRQVGRVQPHGVDPAGRPHQRRSSLQVNR